MAADAAAGPMSARRQSLKERREVKKLSKKPRTRPVPHVFLLPNSNERA